MIPLFRPALLRLRWHTHDPARGRRYGSPGRRGQSAPRRARWAAQRSCRPCERKL